MLSKTLVKVVDDWLAGMTDVDDLKKRLVKAARQVSCCDIEHCTCTPYDVQGYRCEYRTLADTIINQLPTRDDDAAEVDILCTAVEQVGTALRVLRTPPGES